MINDGPNYGEPHANQPLTVRTLPRERVRVGAEWVAAGRVRISRRVVSETRMVQVTLRREELVIETDAAVATNGAMVGTVLDGPAVAAPADLVEPLVVVLREEWPEIITRMCPYERVTVHVDLAETEQRIYSQARAE